MLSLESLGATSEPKRKNELLLGKRQTLDEISMIKRRELRAC